VLQSVTREDGGLSMINYIIKDCPSGGQWDYTHDEKAKRGGIRHSLLMPAAYKNGPPV
jgi:hypothetical protein